MEQSAAIEPNDLLLFARVAELGSFSRAAERLGLPKSTVSRRLAALETLLGERLLQRTTRRQQLTDFGQLLLEHARQVVLEVEAVAALREQRQAERDSGQQLAPGWRDRLCRGDVRRSGSKGSGCGRSGAGGGG